MYGMHYIIFPVSSEAASYVCACTCVYGCVLSCVWLFATPWTVAHQAPLSMGFSRQEYWSGFPFPPPGDLPDLQVGTRVSHYLWHHSLTLYHYATQEVCYPV